MISKKIIVSVVIVFSLVSSITSAQIPSKKPLVMIIATGGTIANTPGGRLSIETVLQETPEIAAMADIAVHDYIRVGSASITIQNWIDLAHIITRELKNNPEIYGVVVTQGSNTAEETAYFLNLVLDTTKPIVVTAAQRHREKLSEDSSRNLYDAIRVAADSNTVGKGVVLVVNELIHSARDVTKTISHRVEAWDSGDLGVLGFADLDMIRFYRTPTTRHTTKSDLKLNGITGAESMPKVEIVYSHIDADPALVHAAINAGAKGIVVAAYPTGSPGSLSDALKEAEKQGIAVIISHRGGKGRIEIGRDFPSADNLTPQKAKVLLMLALLNDKMGDELEKIFIEY